MRDLTFTARLRQHFKPFLSRHPRLKARLVNIDTDLGKLKHTIAAALPLIIKPQPRNLTIAITAHCNLRCIGCRYGRDFMQGAELPWPVIRDLLGDAKEAGMWFVRFYGGEPLLHPDLPKMIEYSRTIGLSHYLTTNGILLQHKIDELYSAGLRDVTVGMYGTEKAYDEYVQKADRFRLLEAGLAAVRERYGMTVNLRMNWLLMSRSCNVRDLQAAWDLADRYAMRFGVDLIHYSLPYFTEGHDRELQFRLEDGPAIGMVVEQLLELKSRRPDMLPQSEDSIKSIPAWLLRGPEMKIPCDAYQMIWVGADGTVQLCYVTFKLGNLHEQRLSHMLFTAAHHAASRDAFHLNCPNCHCHYGARIDKYSASARIIQ